MSRSCFALAPAFTTGDGVIDYSTREGMELWQMATRPLPVLYDGDLDNLWVFLDAIHLRAINCDWMCILGNIPVLDDHNNNSNNKIANDNDDNRTTGVNILTSYGCVTLEDVIHQAHSYMCRPHRKAQLSRQLYTFLANSITPALRSRLSSWAQDYTFGGNGDPDGVAFLKVLTLTVEPPIHAIYVRQTLNNLEDFIETIDYDIPLLHDCVRKYRRTLSAYGESCSLLLASLLEAYLKVPNDDFQSFITMKRLEEFQAAVIDEDQLMEWASNQYNFLRIRGEWLKPKSSITTINNQDSKRG